MVIKMTRWASAFGPVQQATTGNRQLLELELELEQRQSTCPPSKLENADAAAGC